MNHINIITRRGFFDRSFKIGLGVALSTLTDIPLVMKRALAENNIGLNGKKLFFIFLRGGMDGLNSVIPIQDDAYYLSRPEYSTSNPDNIGVPKDGLTSYDTSPLYFPEGGSGATFAYDKAICLGNGFAALHPHLKFLVPVYSAGDLAVIHRVGYPKQSRSHFDSQAYWETGSPNNNLAKDGIFYRTLVESGLTATAPLTGVSIQSALPLLLRGSGAAMTNLSDPTRYNLLGLPNDTFGNLKSDQFISGANNYPFPAKLNRELLRLQYKNLSDTLPIFGSLSFNETGNTFVDDPGTDGDGSNAYHLFPTSNQKNGGYAFHDNDASKYVVDTGSYTYFNNLKAAAMILNNTDAVIAGTELGSFDTHNDQGIISGPLSNLQKRVGWSIYALRKYFTRYANKVDWNNVVVVTLSEFGRTTKPNDNAGTDHAEAGVMMVAGGAINGGVFGCHPTEFSATNPALNWTTGMSGSLYGVPNTRGYLKRIIDYRSVLGEIIREHLGASTAQLHRIIPGYANESTEHLLSGGTVLPPFDAQTTSIRGELGII
jgi:uncharacterized protein (DUF1501 family)